MKTMIINILTLFPKMFKGPFDESIIKRAQDKNLVEIKIHNLRDWVKNKHKTVDDRPYGGGAGMILKVDIIYKALKELVKKAQVPFPSKTHPEPEQSSVRGSPDTDFQSGSGQKPKNHRIILLDPAGEKFNQKKAKELSKLDHLILICGHYEGVDERVKKHLIHEEISIGDFVLTGGELPAMVLIDTIVRLIPGVLKKPEAIRSESFSPYPLNPIPYTLLDFPHYTRPPDFLGWKVPKILLSGNHQKIQAWRLKKSLEKTCQTRPDLLPSALIRARHK